MGSTSAFRALTIISPMREGNDEKNQDRACWFEPGAVAAVCDGVTTSPLSAEAAELVTRYSPVLFQGPIEERLRVMCDLLIARRMEAMRQEIRLPDSVPESMRDMLSQVGRENMSRAFQTTLVAACLTMGHGEILADVVSCGDSLFLAFEPNGRLLLSSARTGAPQPKTEHADTENNAGRTVRIGPRDELLVRVQALADRERALLRDSGIMNPDSWLVCRLLDVSRAPDRTQESPDTLVVGEQDRLLVPAYLAGRCRDADFKPYRKVPFSRMIQLVSPTGKRCAAAGFDHRGSVTLVLPDHFYTGGWHLLQDRFPADAQFVLATDGFYGAFPTPGELWQWLCRHERALMDPERQSTLLTSLHARLSRIGNDDDLSFIWIRPVEPDESSGIKDH